MLGSTSTLFFRRAKIDRTTDAAAPARLTALGTSVVSSLTTPLNNDALSESADINQAIQNVRDSGYDVYLVLEATIGFNRRSGEGQDDTGPGAGADVQLQVNSQDMKFLKSLKIKVDDLES